MIIKHYQLPTLIFIAMISLLFLYLIPTEHYLLKSFFRVVPMTIILYYAMLRMQSNKIAVHIFIVIGFLFSMVGDLFYYWPILEFILTPAGILNGYIFYSIAFFTQVRFSFIRFLTIIPILIFGYTLIYILFKELDQGRAVFLIFFIFVYALFAVIMWWSAILTGNKWVIAGSLLFVMSDTIRALNQFVSQGEYSDVLIILPYFGAQFLIVHSLGTFSRRNKRSISNETFT